MYDLSEKLSDLYNKLPTTKCLGCPIAGGVGCDVVAECCKKAAPALYFVEFLNVFFYIIKNFKKSKLEEIIKKCYEYTLFEKPEKPCVFLDQETNKCLIYNVRWYTCREYGLVSDDEWKKRMIGWTKELLEKHFIVKKPALKKSEILAGNTDYIDLVDVVDYDSLNNFVEELFKDFDIDRINNVLKEKFNIQNNFLYHQCKNLEIEDEKEKIKNLNDVFKEIQKINAKVCGYQSDQDITDVTYLAFHIHMLNYILGPDIVENLIYIRYNYPEEVKIDLLDKIYANINNFVENIKIRGIEYSDDNQGQDS